MVTCGFCGTAFEENRGQSACQRCPLGADCGLLRCPACGYENPAAPPWVAKLRRWAERRRAGTGPDDGAGILQDGPETGRVMEGTHGSR